MLQSWVEDGFELATHTSYHSNFNAADTGPRPDFMTVDYEAEICRSAALIANKLGERGTDYRVTSLILPYGSGYAYRAAAPYVHDEILQACRRAEIRFVVGIAHGREPVARVQVTGEGTAVYLGRIPPVYCTAADGKLTPAVDATLAQIAAWQQQNESLLQSAQHSARILPL